MRLNRRYVGSRLSDKKIAIKDTSAGDGHHFISVLYCSVVYKSFFLCVVSQTEIETISHMTSLLHHHASFTGSLGVRDVVQKSFSFR